MGSGDRVVFGRTHKCFAVGFGVGSFPFAVTVHVNLGLWYVSVGFGKGYDQ